MPGGRKLLVIAVSVLAGAWMLDLVLIRPWMEGLNGADAQIRVLKPRLAEARAAVADRKRVDDEWKALSERLGQLRGDEAATRFDEHLGRLTREVGLGGIRMTPDPGAKFLAEKSLREHAVELSFPCTWEQLVRLLVELNNSDEFVRVARFAAQSHYPKEARCELTMRVSTVALANGGGN